MYHTPWACVKLKNTETAFFCWTALENYRAGECGVRFQATQVICGSQIGRAVVDAVDRLRTCQGSMLVYHAVIRCIQGQATAVRHCKAPSVVKRSM